VALFAGNNQGTVTRVLAAVPDRLLAQPGAAAAGGAFLFLHAALGALAALFDLPRQALRWRTQQKERRCTRRCWTRCRTCWRALHPRRARRPKRC
jgi:HemY protein